VRHRAHWIVAIALAVSATAAAQPEEEPTPEDLTEAKAAYDRGAVLFEARDFKGAVAEFKESYRLSRNPLLLYNIGYTLDELGDKKLALFYYEKFLSDSPEGVKNRDTAAERARALKGEIESGADSEPPVEAKTVAPATPTDLQHNVVGEAPPGQPLDITASAPRDVGWTVYLFYRGANDADFRQVEMAWRYSELVGRVPPAAMSGSSLQYYVEARDAGDEVIARSGRAASPHVVLIDASAKARFYPDFGAGDAGASGGAESFATPAAADRGPRTTMDYAKWGATGASLGFLALSATFLFIASDAASAIEGEAFESREQDQCAEGRPCRPFDGGLESRGKRYETLGNVTLGLALAAGATAGVLWYLDRDRDRAADKQPGVTAAPAVGRDFVGAAARWSF
jgi:hypothetical protein